jgi:hypothetical protein
VGTVTDEAETFLRLLAETELRRAIERPEIQTDRLRGQIRRTRRMLRLGPSRDSSGAGLRRLQVTADAFARTGLLAPELAQAIVASQETALVARRRIGDAKASPEKAPPAGQYRAVGIGEQLTVLVDGQQARLELVALVLAPDRTVLTLGVTPPGGQSDPDDSDPDDRDFAFLWRVSATDSLGTSYRASYDGAGTGRLKFRPPVPADAGWLDVTFAPASTPYRISFNAQDDPPTQFTELLPEGRAERYLDSATEQLLRFSPQDPQLELADFYDLTDVLTALRGVNAIGPDDPAVRRLVTIARLNQLRLPADLAEVAVTDLPPAWRNVLDYAGAQDGPVGFAPVAAVLPELDGTRWAIAGLRSGPASAELQVLSWGLTWHPLRNSLDGFTWWARDSTGRWHFVQSSGAASGEDHTDFELELTPAIDPAATTLDLMLTGRSGQLTMTLPLDWKL